MSIYIAQWIREGDGIYDPPQYVKIESSSKENARKKAKRLVEEHFTLIGDMMIFTVKEYGELMVEKLGTIG